MTKCTKDAARYPNREEAMKASIGCRRQCRKDYTDDDAIEKCFTECLESDWSFEPGVKFSEQIHSILDKFMNATGDLSTMLNEQMQSILYKFNDKFNDAFDDLAEMPGSLDLMGL